MKHVFRHVARWGLTLHIYLSMAGFLLVLLFAVTGFTLNHDDFGMSEPRDTMLTITVPRDLMGQADQAAIVASLRAKLAAAPSTVSSYHADPDEIDVTFTAPGRRTQVAINRLDGTAQVDAETRGLMGRLGDLHKGLDTGSVWRWTIDVTAILLTISALTGIVTLLTLPRRRRTGLMAGAAGIVALLVIYFFFVPK